MPRTYLPRAAKKARTQDWTPTVRDVDTNDPRGVGKIITIPKNVPKGTTVSDVVKKAAPECANGPIYLMVKCSSDMTIAEWKAKADPSASLAYQDGDKVSFIKRSDIPESADGMTVMEFTDSYLDSVTDETV